MKKIIKSDMVIKGLQQCMMSSNRDEFETQCEDCPYFDPEVTVEECMEPLKNDALTLLKEQQKRIETLESLRRIEQGGGLG